VGSMGGWTSDRKGRWAVERTAVERTAGRGRADGGESRWRGEPMAGTAGSGHSRSSVHPVQRASGREYTREQARAEEEAGPTITYDAISENQQHGVDRSPGNPREQNPNRARCRPCLLQMGSSLAGPDAPWRGFLMERPVARDKPETFGAAPQCATRGT